MTDRIKVSTQVVLTVAGWLAGVLLAYGAMNARVAVIEDRVNRMYADIAEIKADVKTLVRKP